MTSRRYSSKGPLKSYKGKRSCAGVTRLERLVASAREQAQQETFLRLTPLLTTERRMLLDQLLVRDETLGRTRLDWFRQGATASTPRAILGTLDNSKPLAFGLRHSPASSSRGFYRNIFMCYDSGYGLAAIPLRCGTN